MFSLIEKVKEVNGGLKNVRFFNTEVKTEVGVIVTVPTFKGMAIIFKSKADLNSNYDSKRM